MPNTLDQNGLQIASITEILSEIQNGAVDFPGYLTIFPGANLQPNSPDANLINIFGQVAVDLEEFLQMIYDSFDPDQAIGPTLDARCAINGVAREGAAYTTQIIYVTCSIPSTSLNGLDLFPLTPFTVADAQGNQYQLLSTAMLPAEPFGTPLVFRAAQLGAVQSNLNTITTIVTVVAGISAVNNPTAPLSVGQPEESDGALRIRRANSVANGSSGYVESLLGAILAVPGVEDAVVLENDGPGVDARGVPGHSIWAIVAPVAGGLGQIASPVLQAIYEKKGAGAGQTNVGTGAELTAIVTGGAVVSVTVNAPGSGFFNPPTVKFVGGGGGSGATGTALTNVLGQIIGITITNGGTGYAFAPFVELNPNTQSEFFYPAAGAPIAIAFDLPVAQPIYFKAQIDPLSGQAPDLAFLATQLAATYYDIGAPASASALVALLISLAPNCYVTAEGISTDDATWLPFVSPTAVNYQFNLPVGNITLTA